MAQINCKHCKQDVPVGSKFCNHCGKNDPFPPPPSLKAGYDNAYGIWSVTTEGDEEGRTVRNLGTHEGYIDDIAYGLAGSSFYSLRFSYMGESLKVKRVKRTHKKVSVSFGIGSGTWDMSVEERARAVAKLFDHDPRVTVEPGTYYASFVLNFAGDEK